MPVRPPLPVISAGAVAVLAGLALGIGLGGTADDPHGGGGAADPSGGGDPGRRQAGGDLPPMDFEGKVLSPSSRPSKASTTGTPSTTAAASATPGSSEPPRTEEATSAVGVTPTPDPPSLPAVPEVTASSLVETPSSPVATST